MFNIMILWFGMKGAKYEFILSLFYYLSVLVFFLVVHA